MNARVLDTTPGNSSPAQTARSQLDPMSSFFSELSADPPQYRQRLYELFSLIDKEFENLYVENCQLKVRLGQAPESSLQDLVKSHDNSAAIFHELKASGKKSYQRQKWKSAFRGPPQRLVTSLKVGSGQGSEASKHCFTRNFEGHQDAVLHLASCSNNGAMVIASACADQSARVFDAESGQCLFQYTGHNGAVNSVALRVDHSGHEQFLGLSASGDRTVHLWKTASLSETANPNSSEDDLDATSEKGNDVEDDKFGVVSVVSRQPVRCFSGHSDAVVGAEWLVGGDLMISVSWDRTAHIYDLEQETLLNVLTGHDSELTFCSSHRSSKIVATASRDHTFRLWDFREAMRSVAVFQGHNASVNSAVFAAQHHIISSSDDRTVKIWDLRNMRSPIASSRFESGVNKVGASVSNQLMAIPVDSRHVYIHDLNGNRIGRLHRGNSHSGLVTAAAWLDDCDTNNLVTAGIDKKVFGWRVAKP